MIAKSSIQGRLAPDCLNNVLMLIAERRSERGVLHIEAGSRFGEIWVHDGLFLCASFGSWRDEDAVDHMLQLTQGSFAFTVSEHQPSRTLLLPLARAVEESVERIAIAQQVAESIFDAPPASQSQDAPPLERFLTSLRMAITSPPVSLRRAEGAFDPLTYILTVSLLAGILAGESFVLSRQIRHGMAERTDTELALENQEQELQSMARHKLVYRFVDRGHMLREYGLNKEALEQYRRAETLMPGDTAIQSLVREAEQVMATNAPATGPSA